MFFGLEGSLVRWTQIPVWWKVAWKSLSIMSLAFDVDFFNFYSPCHNKTWRCGVRSFEREDQITLVSIIGVGGKGRIVDHARIFLARRVRKKPDGCPLSSVCVACSRFHDTSNFYVLEEFNGSSCACGFVGIRDIPHRTVVFQKALSQERYRCPEGEACVTLRSWIE